MGFIVLLIFECVLYYRFVDSWLCLAWLYRVVDTLLCCRCFIVLLIYDGVARFYRVIDT